jgi:hypothetical protein
VELAREGARIIVQEPFADALLHVTYGGTIYEWAAAQPDRRELQGRLPVYAVALPPDGPRVVVRRNHHGGLLAKWRGDRFFVSRMPYELVASLVLTSAGIVTAEVIAHAAYRVNRFERRIDVVTRELPPGRDLGAALREPAGADQRAEWWRAVTGLLDALASKGVWHQDLNVKNIYLLDEPGAPVRAVLLDVDRVRFHPPGALVARANAARLVRSLRKLQRLHGALISDTEFSLVTSAAAGA